MEMLVLACDHLACGSEYSLMSPIEVPTATSPLRVVATQVNDRPRVFTSAFSVMTRSTGLTRRS